MQLVLLTLFQCIYMKFCFLEKKVQGISTTVNSHIMKGCKHRHQLDIHVCAVLFPNVQVTNRSISGVEGFGFWKGCF